MRCLCFVVLKTHSVKGHWCEVRKALTREEMSRVRTGEPYLSLYYHSWQLLLTVNSQIISPCMPAKQRSSTLFLFYPSVCVSIQ